MKNKILPKSKLFTAEDIKPNEEKRIKHLNEILNKEKSKRTKYRRKNYV